MIDAGVFQPGDHVELIEGEILAVTPQKSPHATAVQLAGEALRQAVLGMTACVREEKPLAVDAESEPEPDIAVVSGSPRDYRADHPTHAWLIVEVAESSLTYDRRTKGPLYARAGIAEYWIVNLPDGRLEVYRDPLQTQTGWDYRVVQILMPTDVIHPLAMPDATIPVADLLP
jgi:Uma2 family endonuclease